MSSVLERVGLGLAPLDEAMAEIAHRAISGHIYRMETCLAMLARMNGEIMTARLHLSEALHHATLVDDVESEMLATNQLGLLALARNRWARLQNYLKLQTDRLRPSKSRFGFMSFVQAWLDTLVAMRALQKSIYCLRNYWLLTTC